MSNDITTAERAIQVLHDRLHVCSRRANEAATDRQKLAYAAFVQDDPAAVADLEKLRHRGAELADEVLNIKSAIVHADACLVAAKAAVAQTEAQVHIDRINELLTTVQELAPGLDVSWGAVVRGSAGVGYRHEVGPKNGPLFDKVGNLVGEITRELKALKLDRAVWLPHNFALMHISDFRRELEKLAGAYRDGPPVRAHNFVELVANWSASVKALAQHGQPISEERAA
jgi:hypothetical protein